MYANDSKSNPAFFFQALLAVAVFANTVGVMSANGQTLQNSTTASQLPETQRIHSFSDRTLAEINPGHTTKAGVKSLLGEPWRVSELDEEDAMPGDPAVEVWEYRGRDSRGTYRVHIRFDKRDVTTLIAKIPDKTGRAVARMANPMPDAGKP